MDCRIVHQSNRANIHHRNHQQNYQHRGILVPGRIDRHWDKDWTLNRNEYTDGPWIPARNPLVRYQITEYLMVHQCFDESHLRLISSSPLEMTFNQIKIMQTKWLISDLIPNNPQNQKFRKKIFFWACLEPKMNSKNSFWFTSWLRFSGLNP